MRFCLGMKSFLTVGDSGVIQLSIVRISPWRSAYKKVISSIGIDTAADQSQPESLKSLKSPRTQTSLNSI